MKRPSPALIISCLALFVALSGTSYAVSQLPKNSVGNKQIKKSAVNSDKVKDRSLLAKDFKNGQLPTGSQGPQGARGPSASAYAANGNVGIGNPPTTVIALGSSNDASTGPITITTPSRVVFNAAIELEGGTTTEVRCDPSYNNGSGWTALSDAFVWQDLLSADNQVIALTYGFAAEPGTVDIRVDCGLTTGTASARRSRLTAVATAR
ncbi:MAG: hypothetical protein ACSLFF_00225 [Solirubrobacterales bacterium]